MRGQASFPRHAPSILSTKRRSHIMRKSSNLNDKAERERLSRRSALKAGIAAGAGVAALAFSPGQSPAQRQPGKTTLSDYTMVLDRKDTALVVIDPQNDVLSEKGVSWELLSD